MEGAYLFMFIAFCAIINYIYVVYKEKKYGHL